MNTRFFWQFLAVPLLFLGCGTSPEEELAKLAQNHLEPHAVQALVGSDSAWARYCDEAGLPALLETVRILRNSVSFETETSYTTSRDHLRLHLERVSRCLCDSYHFDGEWSAYEGWSHRTLEQVRVGAPLSKELMQMAQDTVLTPKQRLVRLEAIERELGSGGGVVNSLELQAREHHALGNHRAALACLRRALLEQEKGGRGVMTMSLLIKIGYTLGQQGQVDSMLIYLDRALQMAKESRDPASATRALRHIANHYRAQGQEAVAFELLRDASDLCREFKGDNYEFISILDALAHYTRYGAWNQVENLLERGDRVLAYADARANRSVHDRIQRDRIAVEFGFFKGRYLMATGRVEEGERVFRELRSIARRHPDPEKLSQLLYFWSSSLLLSDQPSEAVKLAREGLSNSASPDLLFESLRLHLILADASCRTGELQEARNALTYFKQNIGPDTTAYRNQWMLHDKVEVCLALASGNMAEAERAAHKAMAHLVRILSLLDQSVQACLFLDDCRDLREAIHLVLSKNHEAGYGFEMAWRSLYEVLGNRTTSPKALFSQGDGSFAEQCATFGRRVQKQIANSGSAHCVYFVDSQGVVRWTASSSGLIRERIPITTEDLKHDVATLTSLLASTSTEPWSREVVEALTRISILLPDLIRGTNAPPGLLLVSPDLYLTTVPFEAIDRDATVDYHPLQETWDVAYLRSTLSHFSQRNKPTHGLVVGSPVYPATLRRRYPGLTPLPFGEKEAGLVSKSFPNTENLRGNALTKAAFRDLSEGSGFIYVASHFIQSVETPYVSYLPLAASDSAALGEAMLDYGEIRKADLSRCDLVVLSGCGTGAAYTNTRITAPSLSDAFLDAGARAVVHTRWRVLDDEAYEFASDFIKSWTLGESPIIALNDAKRAAWSRSGGQPSTTWAAYSITLSEIPAKPLRNRRSRS